MKRRLIGLTGLIALIAGGLYYVPPYDPLGFVKYTLFDPAKDDDTSYQNHLRYSRAPRDISMSDCKIMAMVIKTQWKIDTDSGLRRNTDGRLDCPFDQFGITSSNWEILPEGYLRGDDFHPIEPGTKPDLNAFLKDAKWGRVVQRPVYSLFRTRLSIEFGQVRHREGTGFQRCWYNRFTGAWKLERCEITLMT